MKIYQYTLKNKLKLLFVENNAFSSLTTLLLVGAGSRYENKKNNGIGHFFEHMAFKGSKKYPNSFLISSTIEGIGGVFNAFTSKDHTGYWIKSTPEHFLTMIDVLSDMILNPILAKDEIEREKGVIVEEINMYEDNPQRKILDLFDNLIFGEDHPLGFDIAGKKETVLSFNRQTFIDYINKLYKPENAVLVIAGNLKKINLSPMKFFGTMGTTTPLKRKKFLASNLIRKESDRLLENKKIARDLIFLLEEKFSLWSGKKRTDFISYFNDQKKPKILIKNKKTEQTHFVLGFPTFSFFDEKKYPLQILSTILGSGMSSRLFIEVRERLGLCYYISSFTESFTDTGYYAVHTGVANNLDKVKKSIRVILKEHQKIIQGKLKKEDFQRAKEMIKGRLILYLEDTTNLANFFGVKQLLMNKLETPEEILKKITSVKIEQVVDLAKEIFKEERLNLALIGNYQEKDFKDVLNF